MHAYSCYEDMVDRPPPAPPLMGDVTADVVVLGGGLLGVTAALELAERGYKVVLLEAERIGYGASGRSGGQIMSGFNRDVSTLTRMVGAADARKLWDMNEAAKAMIAGRIQRHAIDCDYHLGHITCASRPKHVGELQAMAAEWQKALGYTQLSWLPRKEMQAAHVHTEAYYGGLYDAGAGQMNSLAYVLGLARAAVAAGARIYEQSPVIRIVEGETLCFKTAHAKVTAKHGVLAGNALLGSVRPDLQSYILAAATSIIATEPVSKDVLDRLLPSRAAVITMDFVMDYFRPLPDGRIIFGGDFSYAGYETRGAAQRLSRKLRRVFPELAGVGISHAWSGKVDLTRNRMPQLGRLGRNLYFAQGFSGHGLALTGLLGQVIAEAITAQTERYDVWSRIKHARYPLPEGVMKQNLLALGMLWYRLRDLL